MTKKAIIITIGICVTILGFISKMVYRPWILRAGIDDWHINGFLPSFLYTLGICLFAAALVKKKHIRTMVVVACGSLAYEAEQLWTRMIFDYMDIIAIIAGLGSAILIFKKVNKFEVLTNKLN